MHRNKYLAVLIFVFFCWLESTAQNLVTGSITDASGKKLAHASILIKGTTRGVTANADAKFILSLGSGSYTLVCNYVGFEAVEKKVKIIPGQDTLNLSFVLTRQVYLLNDVTVRSKGEDPAYAIIRNAIKKRPDYLNEIKKFSAEVYIKGQLVLNDFPKSFFGKALTSNNFDTIKNRILFLSETVSDYYVDVPNKERIEVKSSKVSGRSGGFGLSNPQIISFYQNNIALGNGLNPRGFVSPIADGALNFYNYKFEGTFYQNGIEISRIRVQPKRKYEPLFSGIINIIENEWRIHSVQLNLLKEQQLQLLDTLQIEQYYVPTKQGWVIKNQIIYPRGKFFGFAFSGSFVQVYDQFNLEPVYGKKFFGNTLLKYLDSSNKKSAAYWDSVRPVPLAIEEARDYVKKDSLEKIRLDPKYLDSVDRVRNKFKLSGFLLTGQTINKQSKKTRIQFDPLLKSVNFNTVEGYNATFSPRWVKRYTGRNNLSIEPALRFGFSNTRLQPSATIRYNFGKKYFNNIGVSFGKNVFQFNNETAIPETRSTLQSVLFERNYLKIYEAKYCTASYAVGLGGGLNFRANFQYQDREALSNLDRPLIFIDHINRSYTPNTPAPLSNIGFERHQASIVTGVLTWQPGGKYIELPDRKIGIGSKAPTFTLSYKKGIWDFLGSDIDYAKWSFNVSDDLPLGLGGTLQYRATAGGFSNDNKVYTPDAQHYFGNQTFFSIDHLKGFQLLPYYQFSNQSNFYTTLFAEYHLNGLLTNKIPGFRKLNWFLVGGFSSLHINNGVDYTEAIVGIENIFKVLRVDLVNGFQKGEPVRTGVRLTVPVLFR
jgi:hypothetical protein